ncbi:YciI family protein [Chryseobacterium indoltheticum]|uniref:YciI family protein n=1 Tax=Chryseobacterium indoltheticum TaxID=254 RepID=UPI003F497F33
MKNLFLLSGIIFTFTFCPIQTKAQHDRPRIRENSIKSKIPFNQKLADSLGADKYGMKAYTIVMLTTGSSKIDDKEKKAELMKGHMTNIGKLADEGKIIVAGPFLEKNKENYRGMFIFNTKSKEEAESWVKPILQLQPEFSVMKYFPGMVLQRCLCI